MYNKKNENMIENNEIPILTVTDCNTILKKHLNALGTISVSGEITEMSVTSRKGVYMTLSDGQSNIKLSGFAPSISGMNQIEKGMSIIATGIPDMYVPYGNISISISKVEPVGSGSLERAYEKLKQDLQQKGFFDASKKVPLPQFVQRIALLTAKNSAAFADFTKILKENRIGIQVDFFPIVAQGPHSVKSVRSQYFSAIEKGGYDAIILTRGGGSLEDLKSFNNEELVQDIFKSPIPTIVGVGHESDESLADFVADITASTPSQCAYYIVQNHELFWSQIETIEKSIRQNVGDQIFKLKNQIDLHLKNIQIYTRKNISDLTQKIESFERILNSYDISSVLKRGFAVLEAEGNQIKTVEELKKHKEINVTMQDGAEQLAVSC